MNYRFLWIAPVVLLSACATSGPSSKNPGQVSYYDRNKDGRPDLERHHYPDVENADWVLQDDDFNGQFERRIHYGADVKETTIDQPVPTGVQIKRS